jgi:hypothetical protein
MNNGKSANKTWPTAGAKRGTAYYLSCEELNTCLYYIGGAKRNDRRAVLEIP